MIKQIEEYIQQQVDEEVQKRLEEYSFYKEKYESLLNAIMKQVREEHYNITNTNDLTVTRYISEQLMYGFFDILNDSWSKFKTDLSKEDFEFISSNCVLKKVNDE